MALQTAFAQIDGLAPPGAVLGGEEITTRRAGVTIRTTFRFSGDRATTLEHLDQTLKENGWVEDRERKGTFRKQVADRKAELTVQVRDDSTYSIMTRID